MLYREIMVVCSEIHTKHINTLCGLNVELLSVKVVVRRVTTWLSRFTSLHFVSKPNFPQPSLLLVLSACLAVLKKTATPLPLQSPLQITPSTLYSTSITRYKNCTHHPVMF